MLGKVFSLIILIYTWAVSIYVMFMIGSGVTTLLLVGLCLLCSQIVYEISWKNREENTGEQ